MRKLDVHPTTLVIIFQGVWGTIGLLGVLRLVEQKVDATLIAIVTTLVAPVFGSMASMLSNAMKPSSEPVQANITNTEKNPIPTTNANEAEDKT